MLAHERGFTLIEMVVTVAIVALLASIAMPLTEVVVKRGKEQELRRALREIRAAIDTYKQATEDGRISRAPGESGYPKTLDALVEGVTDARSPKGEKIYFLRRIPRDPFVAEPSLSATATWGRRSYASPPDEPQEGDDVFDVYSRTSGNGLNGIAYRQW